METRRRTSSVSSNSAAKAPEIKKPVISGSCTYVRLIYSVSNLDNQSILLNSYSSCQRLLDHMKKIIGAQQDETIDVMDHEGKLKELNVHHNEFATQYLTARNTYYVFKVEIDTATGDKRYTPSFNLDQIDPKHCVILTNSLNSLNKSSTKIKRNTGPSKQGGSSASTTNAAQAKTKRTATRK